MMRKTVIAACLLVVAASAPAYAGVSNGGFESEDLSGASPVPASWTITGDGIGIDSVFPSNGTYDAALGTFSGDPEPGVLSQSLATTPGQSYVLSFAAFDEPGTSADSLVVSFGGFSQVITGDQAAGGYTAESFVVLGGDITAGSTDLAFTGISDSGSWNLDDVSVSAVATGTPEPASMALLASALAGMTLLRGKRRRMG